MSSQDEFLKYATKHRGISSLTLHDYTRASMTPYIIEERQLNVAQMDVFSRLMMDRIIFLGTAINDQVANIIQAQLLFLESVDAKKDIQIYLNSPGGVFTQASGSMTPCNTSIRTWPPFARAWPRAWVRCCFVPAQRASAAH